MTDEQALSFSSPKMPTSENFDQLLKEFGSAAFSAGSHGWDINTDTQNPSDANGTYRYKVNNPIQLVLACSMEEQMRIDCICC